MQSTETSQFTTDATQAPTAAVSPFGPVRKREQPPVKIPGQRKASDTLRPRPAPPTQKLTARPLGRDLYGPDRWDAISAADAFGTAPGNAA